MKFWSSVNTIVSRTAILARIRFAITTTSTASSATIVTASLAIFDSTAAIAFDKKGIFFVISSILFHFNLILIPDALSNPSRTSWRRKLSHSSQFRRQFLSARKSKSVTIFTTLINIFLIFYWLNLLRNL